MIKIMIYLPFYRIYQKVSSYLICLGQLYIIQICKPLPHMSSHNNNLVFSDDIYLPCSLKEQNPELSTSHTPIKAIQQESSQPDSPTNLTPDPFQRINITEATQFHRFKNNTFSSPTSRRSSFHKQHQRERQTENGERQRLMKEASGWQQQEDQIDDGLHRYGIEEEEMKRINKCFGMMNENRRIKEQIQRVKRMLEEVSGNSDELVQVMSENVSRITHWQKGYFDATRANIKLDQKMDELRKATKNLEQRVSEERNNRDLMKVIGGIPLKDNQKKLEDEGMMSFRKVVTTKEGSCSNESSMKVSLLSNSGKKYVKVVPVVEWGDRQRGARKGNNGKRKKIFDSGKKDPIKNLSSRQYLRKQEISDKFQPLLSVQHCKKPIITTISIPQLFTTTPKQNKKKDMSHSKENDMNSQNMTRKNNEKGERYCPGAQNKDNENGGASANIKNCRKVRNNLMNVRLSLCKK